MSKWKTIPGREPDFSRVERMLRRENADEPPPLFELHVGPRQELLDAVSDGSGTSSIPVTSKPDPDLQEQRAWLMYRLGYDFVPAVPYNFAFPRPSRETGESDSGSKHAYVQAGHHMISNREEFETFAWPKIENIDYSFFEKAEKALPDGMKTICMGNGGILENVMWILGYEGFSYLLYDDEQLIVDIFEAVASRFVKMYEDLATFPSVGAICLSDDIGFKTQPMISPAMLRKYLFPWHKKVCEVAHRHGKTVCIHACGNRKAIMNDMIECGWDGIHSFEDCIEPVWEAKETYEGRVSLLGGFDIDRLCRSSEEQVREHTRFLIEKCGAHGGWGVGTGNSVAAYVPARNYMAMLEEAWKVW